MEFSALGRQNGIKFQYSAGTDIGGGKENQDDYFIFRHENILVLGVLDGHGREVGKIAAMAAKKVLIDYFTVHYEKLKSNPIEVLVEAHKIAHEYIKETFVTEIQAQGYEVMITNNGYLVKRKTPNHPWSCVHGGAACSIVAIVDYNMYVANVGDSSGILCSSTPILSNNIHNYICDSAIPPSDHSVDSINNSFTNTLVITAEHSPESITEFYRLRSFKHRDNDPMNPALYVVYDATSHDKTKCFPVFEVVDNTGAAVVTNRGKYYKNVRKEWASLVSTPNTADFPDALAFTRSLGDFHLQTYGVTYLPEVYHIDLKKVLDNLDLSMKSVPSGKCAPCLSIVLATDGIWDNWTYEDVTKYIMDQSFVTSVMNDNNAAITITSDFIQRNDVFAKSNFGNQADNATGIVLYFSDYLCFPGM